MRTMSKLEQSYLTLIMNYTFDSEMTLFWEREFDE